MTECRMSVYGDLLAALDTAIDHATRTREPRAWLDQLEHTRDVARAKHDKEGGA